MIGDLVETVHVSCDSLATSADERPESADVSSASATGREAVRVSCDALAVGADEQSESADVSSAAVTGCEDGKIGDLVETVRVSCEVLAVGADEQSEFADPSMAAATGCEDGKIGGPVETVRVNCDAGAHERSESADACVAAATEREVDGKIGDLVETVRVSCEALALGADERSELYVTAMAGSSNRYGDEYVTARKSRRLKQLRSKVGSEDEYETEKSREHWTVVGRPCSDLELLHVANEEHFQSLVDQDAVRLKAALRSFGTQFKRRYLQTQSKSKILEKIEKHSFFVDYGDELVVGEKIGEGGQAEIFNAAIGGKDGYVLKVLKAGFSLADLERQWTVRARNGAYHKESTATFCCFMESGTLLRDGGFAFVMRKYWGDLRTLIDQNNSTGPPFPFREALKIMYFIARGMAYLHDEGILHRDLKASNVLVRSKDGVPVDYHIADFECAVGVYGTGFWRAPEILQALKARISDWRNIWTEKVDVYSFAMTSYEILTGGTPFGDPKIPCTRQNYDVVIGGERPPLPDHVDPKIQELLTRCWHSDPVKRPSFREILEDLMVIESPMSKSLAPTQHWYGHWMMGSRKRAMTMELFFLADNKIYGGGNDEVGEFTMIGELRGTRVHLIEQHIVQDLWVKYDGVIRHSTIEGTWSIVRGYGARTDAGVGTFLLMQESHKPYAKRSTPGVLPFIGEPRHWTGYYRYAHKGSRHKMSTDLLFADNLKVYGSGTDPIGQYTWLGRYHHDHNSTSVDMTKLYDAQHGVRYKGTIAWQQDSKLVMEGSWTISDGSEGISLLKMN